MKKWLIAGCIFVITIFLVIVVIYYQTIRAPMTDEEREAVALASQQTNIVQVRHVEFYHGTDAYQVIEGIDDKDEEIFVWVRSDGEEIITRKAKDGLSKEQVEQFVLEKLAPQKIISIRLGIEQSLPVYEITYLDEEGRYAYYYMTYKDGTFVKRYSIRND